MKTALNERRSATLTMAKCHHLKFDGNEKFDA
jgi:hypothetical protein